MFAKLTVSVAMGFLGAYPMALASGLLTGEPPSPRFFENPIIMVSGIILFFLTLSLIGPMVRLLQQILGSLDRTEDRPGSGIAFAMLTLGTICAISAIVIQYNASQDLPQAVAMNLNAPGNPFSVGPQLRTYSSASFSLGILTILTFLLGTGLIGLGVWASMKPSKAFAGFPTKPVVREFDEAAV